MKQLQRLLFCAIAGVLSLGMASVASAVEDLFSAEEVANSLTPQDVDVQPEALQQRSPTVPSNLRNVSGITRVAFIIDANGHVVNPRIQRSSDERFEGPTLDAVSGWRFRPAMKDGQPVAVRVILPMRFVAN